MIKSLVSSENCFSSFQNEEIAKYLNETWNIHIHELLIVALTKHFEFNYPIKIYSNEYSFKRFSPHIIIVESIYDADFIIVESIYEKCLIPQICFDFKSKFCFNLKYKKFYTFCNINIIYYDPLELTSNSQNLSDNKKSIWDIIDTWDIENKDDNDYGEFSLIESNFDDKI